MIWLLLAVCIMLSFILSIIILQSAVNSIICALFTIHLSSCSDTASQEKVDAIRILIEQLKKMGIRCNIFAISGSIILSILWTLFFYVK